MLHACHLYCSMRQSFLSQRGQHSVLSPSILSSRACLFELKMKSKRREIMLSLLIDNAGAHAGCIASKSRAKLNYAVQFLPQLTLTCFFLPASGMLCKLDQEACMPCRLLIARPSTATASCFCTACMSFRAICQCIMLMVAKVVPMPHTLPIRGSTMRQHGNLLYTGQQSEPRPMCIVYCGAKQAHSKAMAESTSIGHTQRSSFCLLRLHPKPGGLRQGSFSVLWL